MWVKPARLGVTQTLFAKGGGYILFLDGTGTVMLRKPNVSTFARSSTRIPLDGAFHHVAVTKSGPAVRIYIDGVDRTGTVSTQTIVKNTSPINIGTGTGLLAGTVDEAAVYPRALLASEVASHKAAAGP